MLANRHPVRDKKKKYVEELKKKNNPRHINSVTGKKSGKPSRLGLKKTGRVTDT
jgi:hypothetical protein